MAKVLDRPLSRRRFLGATAAGSAALLMAGTASNVLAGSDPEDAIARARRRDEDEEWFEASVPTLQRLMRHGELSSVGLTKAYLRRIRDLNPVLGAVIETNPDALAYRRQARSRAPPWPCAWTAARHPGPREGQHRDR